MSYYRRQLAEGQTFRCASCRRIKRVKYVPTSDLCRRCAAKKRRSVPNVPVSITDNLIVTTAVEKRLEKEAHKVIPDLPPFRQEEIAFWVELTFWALFIVLTVYMMGSKELNILVWLALLGTGILLHFVIRGMMAKPRREREKRVAECREQLALKKRELAEQRQERIEEKQEFYSSPEWTILRERVIQEEGRNCAKCQKFIKDDNDVTIDHILPRSKYPDFALKRDNLQVLCRQCNSAKRDHES